MITQNMPVKKEKNRINVIVGTVVSTCLYGLGRGVVYQIHGEQMPETVKQIGGGVMVTGGHAEFDIVHDCGKFSKRLPECIFRGVQWHVFDEIADAEEIDRLCENAEQMKASARRENEEQAVRFNAEVERLKTAVEYVNLEQGECSSGKLAAKNIRKELKQFKGVKFSVRNRHYGSIDVNWTDGPPLEKVKAIINKYKDGCFNSMQDIYEYSASPFNTVFGSAQYPSAQRAYSDEMIGKAIAKIMCDYNLTFDIAPTAEDYRTGKLWSEKNEVFHHGLQSKIHEVLNAME